MRKIVLAFGITGVVFVNYPEDVMAYEVYKDGPDSLNVNVTAVLGAFNSKQSYDGTKGGATWQEGMLKYGLTGEKALSSGGVYGGFEVITSGTRGQGDPANNTTGDETTTKIDQSYIGWRSGSLFESLGENGLDFSVGRQLFQIGDGFLLVNDGLNIGKGVGDGEYNRGGAYYLGARQGIAQTAIARIGGDQGLHGVVAWLKSDNRIQAKTEMAAGALEYSGEAGTLGLTYIRGLDTDPAYGTEFIQQRDGMNIYSIRGSGNAGIPNAHFSFELAHEDKPHEQASAGYAEAGYTFADTALSPTLTYRYARYSESWDSFFNGLGRGGYGTWFQGEVASNYSGPFNSNNSVHHVGLSLKARENLSVKFLYFKFKTLENRSVLNLDADELDAYLEWMPTDHVMISPLVGLYKPKHSAENGGSQSDNSKLNVYSQILVGYTF